MKHLTLLALTSSLLALHTSLSAAVPLRWTVETSRAVPAQFEAYQGETLELEAALQSYGKPLEMRGLAGFFWQTNGMGSAYWQTTAAVNSNRLSAVWAPEMDVGAKTYNCFIGSPSNIYHAAFQLRLRPSPGAEPNTLPLPVPVIDFAKVRVLNPPWPDPATIPQGAARPLPKYLHELYFSDSYPEDAAWYYASRGNGKTNGGCSSVRDGGFLYRNFDYPLDDRAEFVVHMFPGSARFASIGVAQVGTNLTEKMVTSGKPSRWYKCLPGATVDGINENGVVAEVNVVDGDPHEAGWPTNGTIHCLGAVRWVLDNATSAGESASNLVDHLFFPAGFSQNLHWMIADERETWIVENGTAQIVLYPAHPTAVMTNFRLYPTHSDGAGQERYNMLMFGGANITNVWYTNAYSPIADWASEFKSVAEQNAATNAWANLGTMAARRATGAFWQSVHTSIYDITNKVLRLAVQEQDDWYTFQVPATDRGGAGGGVDTNAVRLIAREEIAPATNGLLRVETDPTVADWAKSGQPKPVGGVTSVNTKTGEVVLVAADVGAITATSATNIAQDIVATATNGMVRFSANNSLTVGYRAYGDDGANSLAHGVEVVASGENSRAGGWLTTASGLCSEAVGTFTVASGESSFAEGDDTRAQGFASHASGQGAAANNDRSWVWNGTGTGYTDKGVGTFCINPVGGLLGFWIGANNINDLVVDVVRIAVTNELGEIVVDNSDVMDGSIEIRKRRVQIGANANASGTTIDNIEQSIAIGNRATASGATSIAIGSSNNPVDSKNAEAVGNQSIAVGYSSKSRGTSSVAVGTETEAAQGSAVAIGSAAKATQGHAIAVGSGTSAQGLSAVAIGGESWIGSTKDYSGAKAGKNSVAIGSGAKAEQEATIAIGYGADVNSTLTSAVGSGAKAYGWKCTAVGTDAVAGSLIPTVTATVAVAVGYNAKAVRANAVAIGGEANASDSHAIAVGQGATASGNSTIAIGKGAIASAEGAVQIGNGENDSRYTMKFRDNYVVLDKDVVPAITNGVKVATISGKDIFAPQGGGTGDYLPLHGGTATRAEGVLTGVDYVFEGGFDDPDEHEYGENRHGATLTLGGGGDVSTSGSGHGGSGAKLILQGGGKGDSGGSGAEIEVRGGGYGLTPGSGGKITIGAADGSLATGELYDGISGEIVIERFDLHENVQIKTKLTIDHDVDQNETLNQRITRVARTASGIDYGGLANKPSINGHTLVGAMSDSDLDIHAKAISDGTYEIKADRTFTAPVTFGEWTHDESDGFHITSIFYEDQYDFAWYVYFDDVSGGAYGEMDIFQGGPDATELINRWSTRWNPIVRTRNDPSGTLATTKDFASISNAIERVKALDPSTATVAAIINALKGE